MSNPIANNDVFSVDAGLKNGIMAFGSPYFGNGDSLLQNDTDADGDALNITEVNGQTLKKNKWTDFEGSDGGTFRLLSNGAMIFSSDIGFDDLYVGETRETSVTYTVADANGNTSQATVTVTVNGTKPAAAIKPVDETQVTTQDDEINEGAGALFANDGGNVSGASVVAINGESSEVGQIVAGSQGGQFILNTDGSYSFNPSGEFSYLKAGESVVTEVTYSLQDSSGAVFDATVSVAVDGIDDAVVAVDDSFSIQAGANKQLTTDVLNITDNKITNNDVDLDGDAFSLTSVNGQAFVDGQVSVTGDNGGVFTFYEDGNVAFDSSGFTAMVAGDQVITSASYEVTDADGNTASASVDVTIEGPYQDFGQSAAAAADTYEITESNAKGFTFDPRDNDVGGAGNKAFVSDVVADNAEGSVSISAGQLRYTPPENLTELLEQGDLTETFTYKLTNLVNGSVDRESITLVIKSDTPAPVANVDSGLGAFRTNADTSLEIATSALLSNDTGTNISFVGLGSIEGLQGTVTDNGNGTLTYTPDEAFASLDTSDAPIIETFSYVIEDESGRQTTGSAEINVFADFEQNVEAVADTYELTESEAKGFAFDPRDNDITGPSDKGYVSQLFANEIEGSVRVSGGQVRYTPPENLAELLEQGDLTETFSYELTNLLNGSTDTESVTLVIKGEVPGPVANTDFNFSSLATNADATLEIDIAQLLDNDTGANISFVGLGSTIYLQGEVVDNGNGTLTYNPSDAFDALVAADAPATDTFSYVIEDELGRQTTGTVKISVQGVDSDDPLPVDTAVVAVDDSFSIQAGANKQLTTDVLNITDNKITNNDVDLDGDAFSLTSVNGQAFVDGQVSVTGDNGGVFTFYEDSNVAFDASGFNAMVAGDQVLTSASYEVTDANGNTASASIDVTIEGPYQDFGASVVAVADTYEINASEAAGFAFDPRDNDITGPSDKSFVSQLFTDEIEGSLRISGGLVRYTPPENLTEFLEQGDLTETFTYKLTNLVNGSVDRETVTLIITNDTDTGDTDTSDTDTGDTGTGDTGTGDTDTGDTDTGDTDTGGTDTGDTGEGVLELSSLDLRGAEFNIFRLDDGTSSITQKASNQLGNGNIYNTSFSYTIEDETGLSDTADVVVNYKGAGSYVREAQPVTNIQLNEGDVQTLTIDDFLANTLTVDTTELNSPNGWDASDLTNKGFDVQDLGGGSFTIEGPNLAFGESADGRIILHTIDLDGEEQKVIINVESQGTSDDLMVGTEAQLATDDVFNIMESDLGTTLGNLLANDAPDLQLVSIERVGETSIYQDPIVGAQVKTLTSNYGDFSLEKGGFSSKLLGPNHVIAQQFEYTVVDDFGNFDTATITVNVQGEQDGIFMDSNDNPLVAIYENTTLVFDDSILVGNAYDNDGVQDKDFGAELSAVNFDTTTLQGVFTNNGDGSYTYDPSIAFSSLDNGETALEQIAYDIVSGDGSSTAAILELEILGVGDPLVP